MRPLLAAVFLWTACSGAPAPATEPSPAAEPAAPFTVRPLFCVYGGVGLVPVPTPPDYETVFVTQVFEIDNAGPEVSGVTLDGASLRDASGGTLAALRRLDHFVDLTGDPPPDPTWGSFAVFLNGTGTPFLGTLPSGTTRLRIRYAISETGMAMPDGCRAELTLGATSVVVEGPMSGALPSS